jgi:hypothetical protein
MIKVLNILENIREMITSFLMSLIKYIYLKNVVNTKDAKSSPRSRSLITFIAKNLNTKDAKSSPQNMKMSLDIFLIISHLVGIAM